MSSNSERLRFAQTRQERSGFRRGSDGRSGSFTKEERIRSLVPVRIAIESAPRFRKSKFSISRKSTALCCPKITGFICSSSATAAFARRNPILATPGDLLRESVRITASTGYWTSYTETNLVNRFRLRKRLCFPTNRRMMLGMKLFRARC